MMLASRKTRMQILLADDNDAARQSIIEALGSRRFSFYEADCGIRAVQIAQEEELDLSFLDLQMPDISGLDVLRRIRQFNATLPCVLVSGARTREITVRALHEGADTMLDKPLTVELIRFTVRRIMKIERL